MSEIYLRYFSFQIFQKIFPQEENNNSSGYEISFMRKICSNPKIPFL